MKKLHWLTYVGLSLPVLVALVNLAYIQATPREAYHRPDYVQGRILLAKLNIAATALAYGGLFLNLALRKDSYNT